MRVVEVRVGTLAPLGPANIPSGIRKVPVAGSVAALAHGLEGDEQGDRRHHGGRDKAVHAYPVQNYPLWTADLPDLAAEMRPGAFGENLVVEGAVEADVCLGDRWQLGYALLEVSQSRQPCWRLNLRFGRTDMARRVQDTGRTGWYFRVLEEGKISAGDTAHLVARPHPDWPLDRVWHLLYCNTLDRAALAAFAALPGLPERWRALAEVRLSSGRTEDWSRRIETPQ
ncbi:MOSC domain-containing protein [Rhodobacteraceae bacterium 2CG4]|uniref:MOSC domain-containing protein n=1 Tax=Halovulum marinum TaxID=2662447 RepID=A0A6L5Z5H3_9RHOB|nr:MOSC domain-containing protein [Halovulum marinum]MSU91828.1 MOSC domain-containing protein [Halovulum marinum]